MRAVATRLGIEIDEKVSANAVLNLVREAPDVDEYLEVRVEVPPMRPGQLGMLVPKTRIFVNLARSKQLWGDAIIALAVFVLTQSLPIGSFLAMARKLYDNFTMLTDDEAEVVRDFFVLTGGRPYQSPIEEAALRPRFAGTLIPLDDVLEQLEAKGIITRRHDGRLVLVF